MDVNDTGTYPADIRRMSYDELRAIAEEPMSTDPIRRARQADARGEYAERRFVLLAKSLCEVREVRRASPVEDKYMATDAVVTMRDGRIVPVQVKNTAPTSQAKQAAKEFGVSIVVLPADLPDAFALFRVRIALGLTLKLPDSVSRCVYTKAKKEHPIHRWEDDGGFVRP